jgi:hypothetical protein
MESWKTMTRPVRTANIAYIDIGSLELVGSGASKNVEQIEVRRRLMATCNLGGLSAGSPYSSENVDLAIMWYRRFAQVIKVFDRLRLAIFFKRRITGDRTDAIAPNKEFAKFTERGARGEDLNTTKKF